ncbi:MAG: hypothetical protein ACRDVN_05345 [Jiangellaceae bacterium]
MLATVTAVMAILFTVALPRGLWGLVTRGRLRLFPAGYELRP